VAETLEQAVARLKALTRSGLAAHTSDGMTSTLDQPAALRALRDAQREQAEEDGTDNPRPVCAQIKLT
jgi:hypothetical protein